MNVGVGQTGQTCWFFSSLNIFLTSDNGLKILWQKLQETLPKLKARQRNYFNSNINAPCPYKGAVKKTSAIYFWKFLNQYICAVGGPGRLLPESGLNAYLTKNVKWRNIGTREAKGTAGAFPSLELPAILGHLGFRVGRDFRMVNFERWRYKFKNNSWTAPILMYSGSGHTFKLRDLMLEKKGYDLTGAIVYVLPALGSNLDPHVWACTIRNGKGYITDSNYPTHPKTCDWWLKADLERHFMTVNQAYRTGVARIIGFDVVMYTRKEFTNKISPYCLLPQGGYRPMTQVNRQKLAQFESWGPGAVNFLKTGRVGEAHKAFTPRVLAEAVRRNAGRPRANVAFYNAIVNKSTSFHNGLERARTATKNGLMYAINTKGKNYMNFKQKLIAKHPKPFPETWFKQIWGERRGNMNFIRLVKNFSLTHGYTYPKEKIESVMAKRQTTRYGARRKVQDESERVYRINNTNWLNNNGRWVNVNPNNWVRTNSNAETNNAIRYLHSNNGPIEKIETFRRKTFRDV
jgi:hypothetical protein